MTGVTASKGQGGTSAAMRRVLFGAVVFVGFSLIASGLSRYSDVGTTHMPAATPVEVLALRFEDRDDGGVNVRDAKDNGMVKSIDPGTNGFLRSTVRGLVRERKRALVGPDLPFRLTRWSDGTMSLEDEATERRVSLEAFGPTNAAVFAQFFSARNPSP